MSSEPTSPIRTSSSFFKEELARALAEQTFGIGGYTLGHSSVHEASASVQLLERVRLDINLSIRGFQVTGVSAHAGASAAIAADSSMVFETVDALLQHCSPLYSVRRTETLFAKLMS
ncbi:hypothetical protein EW145_g5125 [Phellinidium pouzarii]|uniref:GSKIP domain-containing protein n=1 Tax=Phellinidium pouzarii TaxID=167371 RepID=A0A4S4L301_9AGAM|nr:hypothetical protein EW145_g5125 [Phellinidium pouzarii]